MPLTQLNFQPGIDTENTPTGAESKWIDCDKIRFRKGLPQKIGGWTKFSTGYYVGVGRALEQWFALDGSRYEALGTDRKVYVYAAGTNQDITPIRSTDALTNAISTTSGSNIITIMDTGHGASQGDFVTLSKKYAELHGVSGYGPKGNNAGKILEMKVKVKDLYWDGNDVNEFGYFPNNSNKDLKEIFDEEYK